MDLDAAREVLVEEHTDLWDQHQRLRVGPFDLDAHREHRLRLAAHAAHIQTCIVRLHCYNRQQELRLHKNSDDPLRGSIGSHRAEAADVKRPH